MRCLPHLFDEDWIQFIELILEHRVLCPLPIELDVVSDELLNEPFFVDKILKTNDSQQILRRVLH